MEAIGRTIWRFCEGVGKSIVFWVLGIFGKSVTEEQWKGFMQFVKFSLVGLSNTVISYMVYALFVFWGTHYLVGSVAGFVVGVLNSFYWNNKYVFTAQRERNLLATLARTFMAYSFTGLVLSNALLYLWVEVLHINAYLGPIINLFVTTPINFLVNKLWAFQGGKKT